MATEMPANYPRTYNAQVWGAARSKWWSQRGRFFVAEALVAGVLAWVFSVTEYVAVGWSIGLSTLVLVAIALVWFGWLGVTESARRDWAQEGIIRRTYGDLTEEEVRQAQRDRKVLQRLAFRLLNLNQKYQNAAFYPREESSAENPEVRSLELAIRDLASELHELALFTDHARGEAYDQALLALWDCLDREFEASLEKPFYVDQAMELLSRLEHEDRAWVRERRRFTPPEAPRLSKSG